MADFDIEFCPHCGRELNYMANTCSECGAALPKFVESLIAIQNIVGKYY